MVASPIYATPSYNTPYSYRYYTVCIILGKKILYLVLPGQVPGSGLRQASTLPSNSINQSTDTKRTSISVYCLTRMYIPLFSTRLLPLVGRYPSNEGLSGCMSTAGTYLRDSPAPIKAGRSPAETTHNIEGVGKKKNMDITREEKEEKKNLQKTTGRTGNRTPDLSHAVKQLKGCLMLRENYTTKPSAHLCC
ncbi:hypothetical protein V8C34DRAFT_135470 [Trichoderma compactum]